MKCAGSNMSVWAPRKRGNILFMDEVSKELTPLYRTQCNCFNVRARLSALEKSWTGAELSNVERNRSLGLVCYIHTILQPSHLLPPPFSSFVRYVYGGFLMENWGAGGTTSSTMTSVHVAPTCSAPRGIRYPDNWCWSWLGNSPTLPVMPIWALLLSLHILRVFPDTWSWILQSFQKESCIQALNYQGLLIYAVLGSWMQIPIITSQGSIIWHKWTFI